MVRTSIDNTSWRLKKSVTFPSNDISFSGYDFLVNNEIMNGIMITSSDVAVYNTVAAFNIFSYGTLSNEKYMTWNFNRSYPENNEDIIQLLAWLNENAVCLNDAVTTTGLEIENIANAIRDRGNTTSSLNYPTEFVSAIAAIPSGTSATRRVTIANNPKPNIYYTDSNMVVHSITSGSTDINDELLPIGTLIITATTTANPPMPFPYTISGVEQIASYSNSKIEILIYKVVE